MNHALTLLRHCKKHPSSHIALTDGRDIEISYSELLHAVDHLSKSFVALDSYGIALAMDNGPAQVIADLAAASAGLWTLPIPPFFTPSQQQNAIRRSGCSFLLTDQLQLSSNVMNKLKIENQPFFLCHTASDGIDKTQPNTAKVTFTSGTSGEPKGLCLSQNNLLAPAQAVANTIAPLGITRHLSLLPYSVLLENVAGIMASLYEGVTCVIPSLHSSGVLSQPPSGAALFDILKAHRADSVIMVPELLHSLLTYCLARSVTLPSLKFIAVGGGKVSPVLLADAARVNLPVYEGYGLSEAGSVVTINTPQHYLTNSVGQTLSHQKLSIAADGEIMLKQPGFIGYCGSTDIPPSPYPTGDLGFIDNDGFVHVTGRKKNVLITSMGRNVSPEWLENLLHGSGEIAQSMIYGDGDRQLSALIVSSRSNQQIALVIAQLNRNLPDYARIHDWHRAKPFTPANGLMTATGKLRRKKILDLYTKTQNQVTARLK